MFDIEEDPDDPGCGYAYGCLDVDEPEWTEADHEAFTAWAVANDPEPWPDPDPAEQRARIDALLAEAVSGPITPVLFGQLQRLDVSSLDADQAVSFTRGWQRIVGHGQAQLASGVARTVRAYQPNVLFDRFDGAARELEAALRLGPRQCGTLMSASLILSERLTGTWEQANAGEVSWANAEILADATATLDDDKARQVEAATLPRASDRTSAQHRDAVRRAVDRIDPEGADERRRQKQRDIRMIRDHYGDGMGRLLLDMTSEQIDLCWNAADAWARQRKAAGDPRTLDQLRCAAFVQWSISFLFHGDGSHCDQHCTHPGAPVTDDDPPPAPSSPPSRQGRPVELEAIWDLASLLGVANNCGELLDSGAVLPPSAMRELLAGGVRLRRMVIDPATGELLELTPGSWFLPATSSAHRQPVCLKVIVDQPTAQALIEGRHADLDPALLAAIDTAHPAIRAMLAAPRTAEQLDAHPDDERPGAALSEFVATRDRYPTNPTAGPSPAKAADREHTISRRHGGRTIRDNLTSVVRRWHNPKTHGGWTVRKVNRDWQWTSPLGRTYTTRPFDYRLGP